MKEISFALIIASSYPLNENEFEVPMNAYLFTLGILRVCLLFDGILNFKVQYSIK